MEKYKYMQLVEIICEAINSNEYPVGKPLPGERELAEVYHFSRQTVRKAIRILCDENVLKQVHGSGNYVLKKTCRIKSGIVAVIATHISLPNFAETLLSIEKKLMEGGYYPLIATTRNRFDVERQVLQDLLQKNIDGLIVEGVLGTIPNPNIGLYKEIVSQGIPIVFINSCYKEIEDAVTLSMDNLQGGNLCGKYLLEKGYANFGGIFKADDQESMQRYSGFARYVSEHGFPLDDRNVLWYTSRNLHKSLVDFAAPCIERCGAIVCFNDAIAFEFYKTLHNCGVKIPDSFEFVAFDKTEFSKRIPHKITTLEYPQETIGKLAATKIMNIIQEKNEKSAHLKWQISNDN